MRPFLSIEAVTKKYTDFIAVDNISLDVADGEFLTFLGPSGSGKSTLLYMIAGLANVSSGDIRVESGSLLAVPTNKREIGMVFQRYTLVPHMTVFENVAFPLKVRRLDKAQITGRVREMLRLVHLEDFEDRLPAQLSGGQQQRVALARALAYRPKILLMDEPLSALDRKLKEELQLEIKRIHRETGVTILYVTHDQEEALRLSNRIAVFNKGRIEQIGLPGDIYGRPASRFVAEFVGKCNFIQARVEDLQAEAAVLRLPDNSTLSGINVGSAAKVGDEVTVLLRPEKVELEELQPDGHGLHVTVADVTLLGEITEAVVKTSWGQYLCARIANTSTEMLRPGTGLTLRILPTSVVLL